MSKARFKLTTDMVEEILGYPFKETAHRCHEVSITIVKSGVIPADLRARVARGVAKGVGSQHSWVVLGGDCYDPEAQVLDPVLWSYVPKVGIGVYQGQAQAWPHIPHGGTGNIWTYGQPPMPVEDPIALAVEVSPSAQSFLDLCGPLDWHGWSFLCNAPVAGWPAAEIIAALADTPTLRAVVPIDRLGMLTDRNPGDAYF